MSEFPDILGEIRTFLRADATISALVSDRIFAGRLPKKVIQTNPQKVIVIRDTVGVAGVRQPGNISVNRQEFEIICYAENHYEASRIARKITYKFKYASRVGEQAFLHWITWNGGFAQEVDPDLEWPFVWQAFTALASDEQLT